ncbi:MULTISPECIES: zinc-ribbon domain-containing protein [unclassified Methanoregula]|uniref:zinc-ribbon domain-containing protein n=1 Tax=unclassified Methanoregula TaxID=2649730 RepID=UPI0009D28F72|nr:MULTISPECIES: zinc ribbon domain-containing protein [unclassified Methanoregula]OPX62747.1 MAG: hypothetical protein A4E33_02134 [Methanoregula sp. PtaB.Bin085]OPY36953.1 MAG: hypothetical protein A4E34_00133 [Methanoregula sp. PtaU1.Bin006]
MGQKFCTTCGAALSEDLRFCQNCGAPILQPASPSNTTATALPENPAAGAPPLPLPPPAGKKVPVTILAAGIILLIIAAVVYVFVIPNLFGTGAVPGITPRQVTTAETRTPVITAASVATQATTVPPTMKPDPFPNAMKLKERFAFGTGSVASEATVYRFWINDTYEWHNDKDNRYYVEKPRTGNKFLFVFVQMQNKGDYRVWFPDSGKISVYYNGATYTEDTSHYKPDKGADEEATPIEVKEVMYYHKLNGDEYVEDFGFSHGTELAYLYPGTSNAVDGYIVYQVPQSLVPEETYVLIPFNAQDSGIWKLA